MKGFNTTITEAVILFNFVIDSAYNLPNTTLLRNSTTLHDIVRSSY